MVLKSCWRFCWREFDFRYEKPAQVCSTVFSNVQILVHPLRIIFSVWQCLKCSDSFSIYAKTSISKSFFYFLLKNCVSWCQVDFGNVRPFLSESVGRMGSISKLKKKLNFFINLRLMFFKEDLKKKVIISAWNISLLIFFVD